MMFEFRENWIDWCEDGREGEEIDQIRCWLNVDYLSMWKSFAEKCFQKRQWWDNERGNLRLRSEEIEVIVVLMQTSVSH